MSEYTARQNQIIQESIQLIAQKGIQGLTIKNISRAIGISEPAIYRHFENKNDIILGIISVLKDTTGENFQSGSADRNTIELLKTMIHRHTERFIANPSLTAIVFAEEIFTNDSLLREPIRNLMSMNQNKLIAVIERGQSAGDIRTDLTAKQLSLVVIGSFRFLVSKWHLMDYNFDLKTEVDALLASLEKLLVE
ncbi:MAG: TetR/AcrR family transcriptional regulator [FCB group bacterium]|nr:TetR/AcrR family transcriptional regulator [FCB group bacterium]